MARHRSRSGQGPPGRPPGTAATSGGCRCLRGCTSSACRAARLQDRLERPAKHWKNNPSDIDPRQKWQLYQEAYQAVLDRTSTDAAPWYVIPADRKWYARLAVTELLTRALKGLDLSWPVADFDVPTELARLAASQP